VGLPNPTAASVRQVPHLQRSSRLAELPQPKENGLGRVDPVPKSLHGLLTIDQAPAGVGSPVSKVYQGSEEAGELRAQVHSASAKRPLKTVSEALEFIGREVVDPSLFCDCLRHPGRAHERR